MAFDRGRALGHYVIQELLGAGGMGEVYAADDTRLKRRVAIKVLPDAVAHDESRRLRFEREAQSVAALNHPNIVTLYAVELADDTMFLTMELVEGRSLTDVIAKRPMGLTQFFAIAIPLADAVAAAHQRGITHRDLKPGNVMVTAEGRTKVLDFGLAKLVEVASADPQVTAATRPASAGGHIVGTAAYMSPEQAEGKDIDARSDLFSLGIVLYEMLTGERPFQGDSTVSVLSSILKDTPRAIPELNAAVPRDLWQVVKRCLVKDPEKRLQSAKDLRNELEEVKQSLESGELEAASSATGSATPGERERTRSRVLVWSVGATLLVLLGATAAWRYRSAASALVADSLPEGSFTILTTQAGTEQHPSLSPDGRWMVYASDAAGNLDIYLQGVGQQMPINLTKDTLEDDDQPRFSPDGERIAFRSGRSGGGLFVMGRTGELVRKIADRGFNPAWSPDGQQVAFSTLGMAETPGSRNATRAELWVVGLTAGQPRHLTAPDAMQPAWSPDGARIAYWGYAPQSRNREIWTIPANDGEPERITDDPAIDWNPVWAPNGRHLYFGSDRAGSLGLWRIAIDQQTGKVTGKPQPIQLPATLAAHFSFSADGSRMVFASYRPQVQVNAADFDPRSGSMASWAPITRGSRTWNYLDVSRDGSRLVLATDYPQEDVFVADANGDNLKQITNDVASDRGVRWSPDGSRILYYSAMPGAIMHIFTMAPDGSDQRRVTTEDPLTGGSWIYPQWSANGERLAASVSGGDGYVFEPDGKGAWRHILIPRAGAGSEGFAPRAWSPAGHHIVGIAAQTAQLIVYDVDRRTHQELGLAGFEHQGGSAWLPDGRRIIAVQRGNLVMVDLESKQVSMVLDAPGSQTIRQPRLTGDGRRLFYLQISPESDIALMTIK
jgi:Tol biopolymer transport system component